MLSLPLDSVHLLDALLESVWASSARLYVQRRDALAMGLGLCGLRFEEVTRIHVPDWDARQGLLRVRSAKGGNIRLVRAGCSLLAALDSLMPLRPGRGRTAGLAFVGRQGRPINDECVRRRCGRITKKLFGRSYSFHCLRHTAACRVYEATRDVLVVQQFLGHRSLQHTQVYLQSLRVASERGLASFVGDDGVRVGGLRIVRPDDVACVADLPVALLRDTSNAIDLQGHRCLDHGVFGRNHLGKATLVCGVCGRYLADLSHMRDLPGQQRLFDVGG